MKLEAIVFDFDGVILESANVKTEAFVALYASHGPEIASRVRAHHLENLGISRFKKFEWIETNLFGRTLSADASQKLGERFSELALAGVLAAPFVRGAERALVDLAALPMFVASGTPQDELTLIVDKRGLAKRFREVHGTPREKPAILRDLMARHRLDKREVLFVGDGTSDHKAAFEVGTEFLARDTPELHDYWVRAGVRHVPDLDGLAGIVASW